MRKRAAIEEATLDVADFLMTTDGLVNEEVVKEKIEQQLSDHDDVFGSAFCFNPEIMNCCPFAYRLEDGTTDTIDIADKIDYTKPEYYAGAAPTNDRKGRTIWTKPYVDEGGAGEDICMITYSVPIFKGDNVLGILTGDLLLAEVGVAETFAFTGLLDGYDARSAPSDVVEVSTGLYNVVVTDFRSFESMFEAVFWLRLSWVDSRLRWNPNIHNKTIEIDREEVWYPRLIHFINEFDTERLFESPAVIAPDGAVRMDMNIQSMFLCDTARNLRRFPFDKYHCSMNLGASGHRLTLNYDYGFDLISHDTNFDVTTSISRDAKSLQSISRTHQVTTEEDQEIATTATGETIYYEMNLERRPFMAWVRLVLPALLINLVGFTAFWIKPIAESVVLGVTAFLCSLAFRETVSMPDTSRMTWSELMVLINVIYQALVIFVVFSSFSVTGAKINRWCTRRFGRHGP